jgi:hypothetical protein
VNSDPHQQQKKKKKETTHDNHKVSARHFSHNNCKTQFSSPPPPQKKKKNSRDQINLEKWSNCKLTWPAWYVEHQTKQHDPDRPTQDEMKYMVSLVAWFQTPTSAINQSINQ